MRWTTYLPFYPCHQIPFHPFLWRKWFHGEGRGVMFSECTQEETFPKKTTCNTLLPPGPMFPIPPRLSWVASMGWPPGPRPRPIPLRPPAWHGGTGLEKKLANYNKFYGWWSIQQMLIWSHHLRGSAGGRSGGAKSPLGRDFSSWKDNDGYKEVNFEEFKKHIGNVPLNFWRSQKKAFMLNPCDYLPVWRAWPCWRGAARWTLLTSIKENFKHCTF